MKKNSVNAVMCVWVYAITSQKIISKFENRFFGGYRALNLQFTKIYLAILKISRKFAEMAIRVFHGKKLIHTKKNYVAIAGKIVRMRYA